MDMIDKIMLDYIKELDYKLATDMFENISSGKKLRSKLLLKIAGENENTYRLCAIIELIHLASLLHDDVIDKADTRRGKPSINYLFGTQNSVMLGDILYSKGFHELSKFGKEISSIISDAVCKLSIGELMDVNLSKEFNCDKEAYNKMIYYKTAILIQATACCGAILAGLSQNEFEIYGKNLGLAFQIIDDVLDITQDSKTLGKPNLSDYKEGKTTLPYIYLYESLDEKEKEILKSFHAKELDESKIKWIKDRFEKYNIIQKTINEAKELGIEAIKAIKDHSNSELESIIKSMIDRDY
ncbi:polyprenyl synthetase family protein [Campylobacter pinnipediorum]|uniref:polyprenyl synthetase family protein n=1 Tax=Campylobacter pinnipediorum TaxID=1965231 RepID=UPI00084CEBE2|nr:polyprenyl synthetase family protein [Campylobacter pinnipediorum]AQW82390.1 octaprenyl-diphosphate synthase [Campylobacter pinnipediorum subsp. pinnipediorum]OPA76507.1 octaprenyl-diphosphate synthase [Campylobacter pinnipediorum subsp. pinnipediorum]